jgi:hypothetical protein
MKTFDFSAPGSCSIVIAPCDPLRCSGGLFWSYVRAMVVRDGREIHERSYMY